jgi:ABC-2 type transport system permease protein
MADDLRRLCQLWRLYAAMDATLMLRNGRVFVAWYLSDLISTVASVTGTLLLAERFSGIGSWSRGHVLFMLGYGLLVSGIAATFFGYNVAFISRRLGRGQLDHTLVQPVPIWMALVTEGFQPISASALLLPGAALMAWGLTAVGHGEISFPAVTPAWLGLLALNLLASTAVVLAFSFLWGSLAFWAPRGAEEISSSALQIISDLRPFPLDGAGPLVATGLLTALPVGFVAWAPTRALLDLTPDPAADALTPAAALLLAALAAAAFRKGLKRYERTGSQRYSGWGHRG